jgi:DnaJ-class molecular chaperone
LSIRVVISPQLALRGGSQLLEYVRLRHKDGQSGLESYPEIFDFHFGAGTQHGDSIRIQRMGHGGANGGAYGDLICDIVIRDGQVSPKADRPSAGGGGAALAGRSVLRISVQKALLGGRVQVETPAGRFKVVIPPCTSSGTKMRLARKGQEGPGGLREDHEFEIQIQTPSELDEESRALIARFALLNPWGA